MKDTIELRGETIEQVRKEFSKKILQGVFVLKITEFNPWKSVFDTGFHSADSVEEALELAKSKLPEPFKIKGQVTYEIKSGTHVMMPVLVKADSRYSAEFRAEEYIKNKYFSHANFGIAKSYYKILSNEIEQIGSKGLFGVGKQEDTYKVTFYLKPEIALKYSLWPYIMAEITDEIEVANEQFLQYCKFGSYDKEGAKRLISQGVDINCTDKQGKNALMYSIELRDKEIIEFLIANGININHCDHDGRNALFYYSEADYNNIQYLIEKGIDYKKVDNTGDNILTYQLRKSGNPYRLNFDDKLCKFLRENGITEDKKLISELKRQMEKEAEDRKKWCPKCQKKVNIVEERETIHGHGDYTVDEINEKCEYCGTILGGYHWQSW